MAKTLVLLIAIGATIGCDRVTKHVAATRLSEASRRSFLADTFRLSRWPRRSLVGVAIFLAGGASNLLDRITYGMVIDFMNVGIGPLRTGIFNVADMAIMLGAGFFLLEGYRSARHAPPTASR